MYLRREAYIGEDFLNFTVRTTKIKGNYNILYYKKIHYAFYSV